MKTAEIIDPLSIDKSISMHIFSFLKRRDHRLRFRSIAGPRVGFLIGAGKIQPQRHENTKKET
jgi:hypothetical protein